MSTTLGRPGRQDSDLIQDKHSTCLAMAIDTHIHVVNDDVSVYLRAHELLRWVKVGPEHGMLCSSCRKPIVEVMTCWDHRITVDHARGGPGTWEPGEDSFSTWRHADGTPCGTEQYWQFNDHPNIRVPRYQVWPLPRCGACGAYDSFHTIQEAYGDRVTCTTCGWTNWYSIGD